MKKLIAFIGTLSIIVTLSIILQVETLTLFDTVERVEPEVIDIVSFEKGERIIIKNPEGDIEFIEFYNFAEMWPSSISMDWR